MSESVDAPHLVKQANLTGSSADRHADWLTPNPRSLQRADAAAWIGETLDHPHTRARLESILSAA